MDLSIVVPVLNEEDNVGERTSRIDAALVDTNVEYEILFVDDGSTDQTVPRLVDLQEFNPTPWGEAASKLWPDACHESRDRPCSRTSYRDHGRRLAKRSVRHTSHGSQARRRL